MLIGVDKRGAMMWTKTKYVSVVDAEGKVIFFSTERFVKDICLGDFCFICGADPSEKQFNNEHILPRWLLPAIIHDGYRI